ncbi:ComEC/Rec2 family competence protein [Marinomonas epiphytica]
MFLASLMILVSSVFMPSQWMAGHFTLIAFLCLYHLFRKQYIHLNILCISLISLLVNEKNHSLENCVDLTLGQTVQLSVKFDTFVLKDGTNNPLCASGVGAQVDLVLQNKSGLIAQVSSLMVPVNESEVTLDGRITRTLYPNVWGNWWQKKLFFEKKAAQFWVEVSTGSQLVDSYSKSDGAERDDRLDNALKHYSSWRFSKALLFGNKVGWSDKDIWIIRVLGLSHVFVVSGLHAGFVYIIAVLISKVIWMVLPAGLLEVGVTRLHLTLLISTVLLACYGAVTNWGEPVIRASLMLFCFQLSRLALIHLTALGVLQFVLWLILLFNPHLIVKPSLWLSFSMVFILCLFLTTALNWQKLVLVQCMLSVASLVLIQGWQEEISYLSAVVNMLVVPLTAFVWFPVGLASVIEVYISNTDYLYFVLDQLIVKVWWCLEWLALSAPLLPLNINFDAGMNKMIMLILLFFWLAQTPLRRGFIALGFILFSLVDFGKVPKELMFVHKHNELVVFDQGKLIWSSRWRTSLPASRLGLNSSLVVGVGSSKEWSSSELLKHRVNWLVLSKKPTHNEEKKLNALKVHWLLLEANQRLIFNLNSPGEYWLYHSGCVFTFFLTKSDTCRRVETLENMLN